MADSDSPLVELMDRLEAVGVVGGDTGWARMIDGLQDEPDRAIEATLSGGPPAPVLYAIEFVDVSFTIRGAPREVQGASAEAETRARKVKRELHGLRQVQLGAGIYVFVLCEGEPAKVGDDARGRPLLTVNVRTAREEA